MERIKSLVFCRYSTENILHISVRDKSMEQLITTEMRDVLKQLKKMNLQPNERQKIDLKDPDATNNCFCIRDTQDIAYLAICSMDCPERQAYSMISDLVSHFSLLGNNYSKKTDNELIAHASQTAENLLNHYNSEDIDKLQKVNAKVNETKNILQSNITELISNTDDLETTKGKMEKLALESSQLKSQTKEVKTFMQCRNIKLFIILALVIIGVILIIVFLFVDTKKKVELVKETAAGKKQETEQLSLPST